MDKPTQFYVLGRFEYGEEAVDFGDVNILAKGVGVEVDGMQGMSTGPSPLVEVKKSEVTFLDYNKRGDTKALGERQNGAAAPLIDVLHRLLWLSEHSPSKVKALLDAARPDGEKLRLVAQALAGRTISDQGGDRTDEQKALDRILASWRSVVEQNLFTRGGA
jgi:putative DNA methylase